jgi:hypothetical protein
MHMFIGVYGEEARLIIPRGLTFGVGRTGSNRVKIKKNKANEFGVMTFKNSTHVFRGECHTDDVC